MTSLAQHSLGERLGGPVGRHGARQGPWFDPGVTVGLVATLVWLVTMARQAPCRVKTTDDPVNAFLRLCYSDIPNYYRGNGVLSGALPYVDFPYTEPVLSGVLAGVTRLIAQLFGARVAPGADRQQVLDGAWSYTAAGAVVLFVCFLAVVTAHLLLGIRSQSRRVAGRRVRAWDAVLIAASPVVIACGMINWDMFAVALVSWAILNWASGRTVLAGVCFGLAAAAKLQLISFYPLPILLAIGVLCWRAGKLLVFARTAGSAALTWGAITVVAAIINPQAVTLYLNPVSELGSIGYVLGEMGLPVGNAELIGCGAILACWVAIGRFAWRAPRRPRVGQLAYLMMLPPLIFGIQFAPQYSLWLLPLVVLARPKVTDWLVFNTGEVIYWLAIWLHLNGTIGPETSGVGLYWAAVVFRIGCEVFVAARIVDDIRRPWDDPVRIPHVDDPVGGILDHAPDSSASRSRPAVGDEQLEYGSQYPSRDLADGWLATRETVR